MTRQQKASRQSGREYVAPVMTVRVRYAKRGRLRFSSHRDFQRAFERALRRANVPMAYSAGFRPHPKISYANAAQTGAASEAEYIEIGLAARFDVDELRIALNDGLPDGLDIIDAVEAGPGELVARLEASVWEIELPGVDVETAQTAVEKVLATTHIEVDRMTKNGLRTFDARAAIRSAEVRLDSTDPRTYAILTVVVAHGTPSVRPDDVLAAFKRAADLVPPVPPRVTRLAQGQLAEDARTVNDPLAQDRAGSGRKGTDKEAVAGA